MKIVEVLTQYSRLDRPFTYFYHGDDIAVGLRVLTSFNNRRIVGYVVSVTNTNELVEDASKRLGFKLNEIKEVLDEKPLLTPELMALSDEVTSYYLTSKISVLNAMLPPSLKPSTSALKGPKIRMQTLALFNPEFDNFAALKTTDLALLNEIITRGNVPVKANIRTKLTRLANVGAITYQDVERFRLKYEHYPPDEEKELTPKQQAALETILADDHETFLLHGVTGSGKTEIYLALAAHYLAKNQKVIMLVPEISLTGMMLASFYRRFGKKIAILHSALTAAEKYDEYRRIAQGEVDIVVGARSAIFAPLTNIGAIILDEEHSESYKQDTAPFYHALVVAKMRAKSYGTKIILGSATPSIEAMARAQKNVYGYYYLDERINNEPLPETKVVNMLDQHNILATSPYISKTLANAINEALINKTQIILLVNRRGYATYVSCRHCGRAKRCKTCGITLTYHRSDNTLKCHHCGINYKVSDPCEFCGENDFSFTGFATQKAEEDIKMMFPEARVLRLDSDVSQKDRTPQITLDKFMNYEADILIGTQMVAKGHDFPRVSLVGVVSTDASLAIPSFRSAERTFQLITQAIGRSGRAHIKGQAIIQTMMPEHYVINYAKTQNYLSFYKTELRNRRITQNPPYYYLLSVTISHQNENIIMKTVQSLKYNLKVALKDDAIVIGPTATFYPASGKNFNETLIVKYKDYEKIKPILLQVLGPFKEESSLYVHINVDPFDV